MNAPAPYPSTATVSPGAAPAFRFDGGAADYLGVAILAFLLTFVTLGIAYPWALCMIQRWRCHHTMIGGRRLRFTGSGLALIGLWIKWFFLLIITLGIYSFWIVPGIHRWIVEHTEFE
ncbi:DUF898 domain-containing protein [Nannocystis pusilla]|uniref:DUF898 domain-containing protein n=1 Tax=Nannocystis pusilla TaxID=889268 RepID=A0ABS7TSF4_9BACT|nr:DUF898 domain-containing protein [Nannocystis pusilla]MBZ5711162.1 DUF898 domain-containing protein [Nannocystis pusilla]